MWREYLKLTKPSIMLLVLMTGFTAIVMEKSLLSDPIKALLVMFGLFATGGSANAFNQFFERDLDAKMERTKKRRPLPSGDLKPRQALIFATGLGLMGVTVFFAFFNAFSGLLALGTIIFYSVFYTLYLKPNTHQNIVIGGAAGSMAPMIAWAAATGGLSITPWLLFLIIFLWTPPHFWALALCLKEDYKKVNLPMLPVVKGDDETHKQILFYTFLLVAVSLLIEAGPIYLLVASVFGLQFLFKAYKAGLKPSVAYDRGLFGYSIVYLFVLFGTLIIDVWVG